MIRAVLLATSPATTGGPAALLPAGETSLLARLVGQLQRLGVERLTVVVPTGWWPRCAAAVEAGDVTFVEVAAPGAAGFGHIARAAEGADGPLLVTPAELLTHDALLARLLRDPRPGSSAIWPPGGEPVLLKVGADDLPVARVEAAGASEAATDAVAELVTRLVRRGVVVTTPRFQGLHCSLPRSAQDVAVAERAMAGVDEDRALLAAAVKPTDGFFTTFFVSPYSRYLARWAAGRGYTPTQVTVASMVLGALAAVGFAVGTRPGLVAGALLLQASFTADCVDGQLARYTGRFSTLGAWLDSVFDRTKEYLAYAALAYGAVRTGGDREIWVLAGAALGLQTARHGVDFAFAAHQRESARPAEAPTSRPSAGPPLPARRRRGGAARAAITASAVTERGGWSKWGKRILVLPIGERFALISLGAAIGGAEVTLVVLLVWGSVAALYSLAGRVLRSLA